METAKAGFGRLKKGWQKGAAQRASESDAVLLGGAGAEAVD
ncbi:hypothetical protein [Streptomyces sp. LN549]